MNKTRSHITWCLGTEFAELKVKGDGSILFRSNEQSFTDEMMVED